MKRCLLILLLFGFSHAQNTGYIIFDSPETWVIEINDTLIISTDTLKINSGTYLFKARPQISYSWPAIHIEGELSVNANDTTYYKLSKDKAISENSAFNTKTWIISRNRISIPN